MEQKTLLKTKLASLLQRKEEFKLRAPTMDKDSRRKEDQRLRKAIQITRDKLLQPVRPGRLEKIKEQQQAQQQRNLGNQQQVKQRKQEKQERTTRHKTKLDNANKKRETKKAKNRHERQLKRGPAANLDDDILGGVNDMFEDNEFDADIAENSGVARGHAGHAQHDQKFSQK